MKERSTDIIEKRLVKAILDGEYKTHDALPSERELALHYEAGRPAVREALQRLERDGWITIRKSTPALVNDYWKDGNLSTIVNILKCYDHIPPEMIEHMLELRVALTPVYIRDAAEHNQIKTLSLFSGADQLEDDAAAYARFDWDLQQNLARLCSNPMYLLIINSFKDIYLLMAVQYFEDSQHRYASRQYYSELMAAILKGDYEKAEMQSRGMMRESLRLWKNKRGAGCEK